MGNSAKLISLLMVVLSTLVFAFQNRANGFRSDDCLTTTLTWHSPASPDSCDLMRYQYDSNYCNDGFTTTIGRMGNYFPIDYYTSGIIKSVDMCFSSIDSVTTAQSCIIYFYKSDQTTIFGQSDPFLNAGATWPSSTWINVPCPDIPYTGAFYAMVDYTSSSFKNFFDDDETTSPPGYWLGLGYVEQNGIWGLVGMTFTMGVKATFLQRLNVCENEAVGIKELSPGSISLYPNPASVVVNIASAKDIRTIEVLNYIGQTIYRTNDVNLKITKLDVSSFNAGEYFVKITTMSGIETTKVTVIH